MDWLSNLIVEFFTNFSGHVLDAVTFIIESIFFSAEEIMMCGENATAACSMAAITVVICYTVYTIFKVYIMETEGDSDDDPLNLLVRVTQSIAIISCHSILIDFFLKLAHKLSLYIVAKFDNPSNSLKDIDTAIKTAVTDSIVLMIVSVIYTICIIAFIYKAFLRGGELFLMKILFPFMAVDLISQNRERWSAFFTSFMITVFGYIPQLICFRISYSMILNPKDGISNIIKGIVMIILAIKIPKWLEKFCYKSGITQTASSGLRTMAFVAPRFIGR